MTKNSSSSRAPAALSSNKQPQTAKKWRTRRNNVQIPTCEPRWEKLQPEGSTLLHSNRMEKDRFRIRVHRNIENAEIRPKPPVEHVSTVNRAAHASRNQYDVLHRQHPHTRRKIRGQWQSPDFQVRTARRGGNVEEEILPKASMTDRRSQAESPPTAAPATA